MPVKEQLRQIFGEATQNQISEHLKAHGVEVATQSTVSAWLRGRMPSLDQLAQIEDIYGVKRGTILVNAGYIDGELADERKRPKRKPAAQSHEERIDKFLELADQRSVLFNSLAADLRDALERISQVEEAVERSTNGVADMAIRLAELTEMAEQMHDFVRWRSADLGRPQDE